MEFKLMLIFIIIWIIELSIISKVRSDEIKMYKEKFIKIKRIFCNYIWYLTNSNKFLEEDTKENRFLLAMKLGAEYVKDTEKLIREEIEW